MPRFHGIATLVLIAAVTTGCGETPTDAGAPGEGTALVGRFGTLVQTVAITPASPAPGDLIQVRSVVVNRGSGAVMLESRICGLDFGGTLGVEWPAGIVKCAGYSMRGELAPGDSVVGHDIMEVRSPQGHYRLRVRQAVAPDAWVELPVEVRAP
jgi:hypothetical protein